MTNKDLIILEPSDYHYYQPLFTLIGGGVGTVEKARHKMGEVLPKRCQWIKDEAVQFEPKNNIVKTKNGHTIEYDYLLVAVGMELHFHKVQLIILGINDCFL